MDKKQNKNKKIESEKKKTPSVASIEELNKKIAAAEKTLREIGVEKDVWIKKPIDVDPSFHFFFTKLKDPKGTLMLKQHAGATVRLLEAPPCLKRCAVKHLADLVELVSSDKKRMTKKKSQTLRIQKALEIQRNLTKPKRRPGLKKEKMIAG